MQSWDIDPINRDYIMVKGSPQETNSLTIPAYFRLKIKRKQWLYAPDDNYGSDLSGVLRLPNGNGTQVEQVSAKALQPLLDDGRAKQIDCTVDTITRQGATEQITITAASGVEENIIFKGLGL